MLGPYSLQKSTVPVSDLKEDDRFYIGGIMYKVLEALTIASGEVEIHMFPVYVDFLPEVCTATLPGRYPIEIYNQPV